MRLLFLRGFAPSDRDPKGIMYLCFLVLFFYIIGWTRVAPENGLIFVAAVHPPSYKDNPNKEGFMQEEIWKDVAGYEGCYQISNFGRVKHLVRKYVVKERYGRMFLDESGYPCVLLSTNHKQKKKRIHRLVALAFIENPENKPQINHKNGIKIDYSVENLEWCTAQENMKHSFATGLQSTKGELHPGGTILKETDVLAIRKRLDIGEDYKLLAKEYGVSPVTISAIKHRRLWRHI